MSMRMLVSLIALVAGCAEAPGERPALEDCFLGAFFAECGGDGPPRLGCLEDISLEMGVPPHSCMWFTGGRLAAGYAASSCPAEAVCCLDDWPFTDVTSSRDGVLHSHLSFWGVEPWNRHRAMDVEVRVDEMLVAPAEASLSCSGPGIEESNPCVNLYGAFVRSGDSHTVLFVGSSGGSSENLVLEIIEEEGSLVARACMGLVHDGAVFACATLDPPRCAVAGTLTINRTPSGDDWFGRLELMFADGSRIDGEF